jgi:hypothetical protein
MHFAEWCFWRVVGGRDRCPLVGRCPWRVWCGLRAESLAVVWVEIGVLGWVVRAEVVGGEGEPGGGWRGGRWWPPRCERSWVSNSSPPWSLRVRRPTRGEDQCPVLT